ncbi:hypothetical protein DFP72DRAFT_1067852 [Ephemerocybe angulata]|uniref:Uncharacterized protein n=1 Tax=Ephemerocybe angulata TaxID=980116 RepID=A0A8H6HZF8_9AGAR|nr:hypothetical protein DFP72DRAFT_1067852 [Tulosesus angulatus]
MCLHAPRHIRKVPHEIWLEAFLYFAPTPRQMPPLTDVQVPAVREVVGWTSPSPHTLYYLSQVCRLFNHLAMRVARRRLVIGQPHDIQFWLEHLSHGDGDVVKHVEVHNMHAGFLQVVMRLLPNVSSMYLRHSNARITTITPTIGIGQPGFQSLTDLTLSGLSAYATVQVLRNLSTVAGALERLWLVYAMRGDATPSTAGERCTFPNLEWLIVGAPGMRFQPQRAEDAMRDILTVVGEMFELPRFRRFDNLEILGYQPSFFDRFGQQLEVVTITSEDRDLDANSHFSDHCPNLKTIMIVLIYRSRGIETLDIPHSVERLIFRVPDWLPWQAEEEGLDLLRRAFYHISRKRLSHLETIVVAGMTYWGHSSGWFCRRVKKLRNEGIEVIEIM